MAWSDITVDATESGLCCASVVESPLSHTDAANLAHVLAALADPIRLQLFSIVAAQGGSVHATSRPLSREVSRPFRTTPSCWPRPASS